ncbi:hypothetical protein P6P00_14440 [Clostridium perfringens]|nr:hypothetical protein [Clostridium perfringens]
MLKKLFLDLNNFKSNLGSVERGDSIELNIKLLDSEDYSRSKFRVLGTKADDKYVEQIEGINLEEKDLKVILEDQFVNCEGIVKLELNVISGETEITTKEFYFFVSNTMNASIIDSADSLPTLEKVSKYVDDAVNNLDALKEVSEDITIINSEFKENEIKRKANEMLREKNEKARVNSESIRITEEEERETNELERIQAENDRKVSESNRKLAENTRKTNEAARVEAELNRQSLFEENEEIRNENENLRIASEKERIKFNSEAKTDELNRKEAEKNRVLAEEERKSSEESRVAAEAIRQNTYTDFNDSEVERKNNEIKREEAEALRVEAETRRDNLFSEKEEERNTSFIESEKVRNAAFNKAQDSRNTTFEESETVREEAFKISEKARNDAEELRVTAESERVKSEKLRVDSEKARVLAEEERNTTFTQKEEERNNTFTQNETNRNDTFTQNEEERQGIFEEAENARKVAESKRVAAETGRVEAEKLRVTAETERVEAENLRVISEEGRVAAETKREEGFNAFEGKINTNTEELKAARSATTGEKFDTLDERIDCEVDRLNKKIEVSFLQQEDKESHDINNTVDGITTDMVIKGRTLQNFKSNVKNYISKWVDNGDNYSLNLPSGSGQPYILYGLTQTLKENQKYTVIVNLIEYTSGALHFSFMNSEGNKPASTELVAESKGLKKFVFTINNTIKAETLRLLPRNGINNIYSVSKNILILEGDWTNKPIPQYFEGIKSFGQEEDKISILSNGKNFVKNLNDYIEEGNYVYADPYIYFPIYYPINSNNLYCSYYCNNLPSGSYLLLTKRPVYNVEYQDVLIANNSGKLEGGKIVKSKTLNENNSNIIYLGYAINGKKIDDIKNYIKLNDLRVQLEIGTNKTEYVCDYDKKDILLSELGFDEGIRGVNSIRDELNFIRNVAIKKIHKYTLTAELNWHIYDLTEDIRQFYIQPLEPLVVDDRDAINCISSTLPSCKYNDRTNLVNHIYCNANLLAILKPKSTTLEEFKQWLRDNPTTVYYKLAEPVETPLDENINLKAFGEKTYVAFENSISGTSSFKAPVNAAATISRLNRENRALEEENKNLRQDFESTTLTLTDSDLELVKQNVDMDFRLMEVEFALDIPQSTLSSNINFKNKKGEVKSMARTPYEMMKIVILSGDYDREDYIHKVGKYYERGRMTKEEHDELMSLMTADEVISK